MALPDSPPAPEQASTPRQARPLRWLLVAGGLFALFVAAGWWTQRPLARIPLPDGGELLLVEAHYGSTFHLAQRIGFWRRLKHFLPGLHRDPSDSYQAFDSGTPGGPEVLWLVFQDKGSKSAEKNAPWIRQVVAMESRMTAGVSNASYVPGDDPRRARYIVGLEVYPRRARQLHLRMITAGQSIEATIPNPFPITNAPPWTPEPVPQSRKLQSGELVLRGVHLNPLLKPPVEVAPSIGSLIEPEFEIRDGDIPRTAFNLTSDFSDATGNRSNDRLPLSEPVWKIHTTIQRNEKYPFPIPESTSLGHVTMPAAGEFSILRLPVDRAATANRYVLLTGSGKYQVFFDKEPQVKPLDPSTPIPNNQADIFQCDQPACRFFSESALGSWNYPSGPLRIVRAISPTGEVVVQTRVHMEGNLNHRLQKDHEFPGTLPPPGTDLEIQFIVSSEESVDFYVRPPQ